MHTKDNQFLKEGKCWMELKNENRRNIHINPQKRNAAIKMCPIKMITVIKL